MGAYRRDKRILLLLFPLFPLLSPNIYIYMLCIYVYYAYKQNSQLWTNLMSKSDDIFVSFYFRIDEVQLFWLLTRLFTNVNVSVN